jgi:rare lipoprotein A (peptidoglycan hydrolase)
MSRVRVALVALSLTTPALVSDRAQAAKYRAAWASWYGPSLYGNPLGCGGTLYRETVGVAHKTMRCGKRLRLCARRCATVRVIDRGPYVPGREFDLTQALAERVGFRGVGLVYVRAVR